MPDPFDRTSLLEVAAAAPLNFNLVDGTVAIATDPKMPFVLFKGYNPNTWFYAPRWGRIATNVSTGEPAFMVTKKVRNNPDGSKTTLGGVLSFVVELVVDLPADTAQWTELVKSRGFAPADGAFNFQPLRLSPGTMDISGLDMYAQPGQKLRGIEVGASSTIALAIELTPDGADHFAAMLGASPSPFPPQVAIMFTFRYQYLIPQCEIQATGSKKKTYDYFSLNAKARASYFGLVNGSAEYQTTRTELRQEQALDVRVVGNPPSGVDLPKLLDAVFDMFVKMEVGAWIEPDPKPVEASAPGGFFGGVSVAMKNMSFSDSAVFNQTMSFSGVDTNLHQVSFNFEQQLGAFDPTKHLFVEEDDIKLDFVVGVGGHPDMTRAVTSASYTTLTGPRTIQVPQAGPDGTAAKGTIQFTWPQRPTSAQVTTTVDFDPAFGPGYIYTETKAVGDSGAAFQFQPAVYTQHTALVFVMALETADPSAKALFKWSWTPSTAPGEPSRPPISGFSLITVDQTGSPNNLPTYDIRFPFRPTDWTGETTPKIEFKIQGLTGEWKTRTASGTIQLFEKALAVSWDGSAAIGGDVLDIPAAVAGVGVPDPSRRARLAARTAGRAPQVLVGGSGAAAGAAPDGAAGGGGGNGPTGPRGGDGDGGGAPSLGYVPGDGEPPLMAREMIARAAPPATPYAERTYPTAYDLRDVNGRNFITPVKDQQTCGSCVAFGVCAAVEGTLQVRRDDPTLQPDFSEAHLFYCHGRRQGRSCGNSVGNPPVAEAGGGWWPGGALDAFQNLGVVDEASYPYVSPATSFDPTPPCRSCAEAEGQVTTISGWSVLSDTAQMKLWISGGGGPLVGAFTVYQDFMDFFRVHSSPEAVYRRGNDPGRNLGGHCVCIVGYDDTTSCWIAKNSWSPHWGADGFFKIGYAEVGVDAYMWGVTID